VIHTHILTTINIPNVPQGRFLKLFPQIQESETQDLKGEIFTKNHQITKNKKHIL
jgi:hypothetical protein